MNVAREMSNGRRSLAAQSLRRCLVQVRDEAQANDLELCALFLTLAIMELAEQEPEHQQSASAAA